MKAPPTSERRIQRAIVRELRLRGYLVHASTPPQSSPQARMIAKADGCMTGFPDLCVFGLGHMILIEVKSTTGSCSTAQIEAHQRLRQRGHDVVVAHSVAEAVDETVALLGEPLRTENA